MGRAEYFDPVSQSRKPIKSGSIVNDTGLEYTPEGVEAIDQKITILRGNYVSHKEDYVHHAGYGNASGTNVKSITLNPVPTRYTDGMTVAFKNVTENSGAVTLNVNRLGAKTVLKSNGNALSSGNLKANSIYTVRYNGVNFILQGEGGEYGTALASHVLAPNTIGTENGIITGTMPNNGVRNGTITTQGGQISIPAGYTTGGSVKAQFANLSAENIRSGVNVGGVVGNVKALGTIKTLHEVFGMKYPFDFPITRSYTGNFIGLVVYTNPSIPEEVGYTKSFVRTILGTYEYNTGGEYNDILRTVITTDSLTISANASMWIGYTLFYTE